MSIKIWKLDICPLELITGDNGKLSTTKIWMNVANVVLSYKVILMDSITWDIMSVYGAIVGGSYIAAKFISMKYANPPGDTTINNADKVNIAGDVKIKSKKK